MIQMIIDTILQIIVYTTIPFLWWSFSSRKSEHFTKWIGLTVPEFKDRSKALGFIISSFMLMSLIGLGIIYVFEDKSVLISARFAGLGVSGIIPLLLFATIQTGLCEEILFRGFLGKRLSVKLGFVAGNLIQAILFGLLHGILLFVIGIGLVTALSVTVFTMIVGWMLGYINEKLADGSIVPGWIVHSLSNIIPASLFLVGIIKP